LTGVGTLIFSNVALTFAALEAGSGHDSELSALMINRRGPLIPFAAEAEAEVASSSLSFLTFGTLLGSRGGTDTDAEAEPRRVELEALLFSVTGFKGAPGWTLRVTFVDALFATCVAVRLAVCCFEEWMGGLRHLRSCGLSARGEPRLPLGRFHLRRRGVHGVGKRFHGADRRFWSGVARRWGE
jgi:hypothetical protein